MSLDEPYIRPASVEDLDRLVELLADLFTIEADFHPDPERQRAGLELMLADAGTSIVLVAATGEVVGMATGQLVVSTAEGAPSVWIEDVVVRREERGRGIGRRLVEAVVSWAMERGATRCQLLADRDNAPALAFYQRLGWRVTALTCLRHDARPAGSR